MAKASMIRKTTFLIGGCDQVGRRSDGERSRDRLEVLEKDGRSMSAVNSD
jgi:hypothetical protein